MGLHDHQVATRWAGCRAADDFPEGPRWGRCGDAEDILPEALNSAAAQAAPPGMVEGADIYRACRGPFGRLDTGRGPEHEQMIKQVRALRRHFLATLREGGNDHPSATALPCRFFSQSRRPLDSLLSGLLGDLGRALGEQPRRRRGTMPEGLRTIQKTFLGQTLKTVKDQDIPMFLGKGWV
jgi:hypothetical protein